MQRILILGAGFAGLWAAAGAARALDAFGTGPDRVEVTLVNRDAWHGIRVRNYEADLDAIRVPWPRCWTRSACAWSRAR